MATIRNPYVTPAIRRPTGGFLDPGIGALFNDIGMGINSANAGSRNDANEARAAYDRARTDGQLATNRAMASSPETLAAIFANGGKLNDSQTQMPADWEARLNQAQAPLDYSATPSTPDTKSISSVFATEGMGAKEQMGRVIQEAIARNIPLTDIAKFFGQGGYLKAANSDRPEDGMKFMPLFGAAANQNTAITERQQDKLEGNDTNRVFGVAGINAGSALAVAKQNGTNQINTALAKQPFDEKIQLLKNKGMQELAKFKFELGDDGGISAKLPKDVPLVNLTTIKGMTEGLDARMKASGYTFKGDAKAAVLAEATRRFQDKDLIDMGYKNPTLALDSVFEDLQNGQLARIQAGQGTSIWDDMWRNRGWNPEGATNGDKFYERVPNDKTGAAPAGASQRPAPLNSTVTVPTPAAAPRPTTPAATPPAAAPAGARYPMTVEGARGAIAAGADRGIVIQRLKSAGLDPAGL
jgi:hypothetical protein